jgi:hypothetical protein
VHIARVSPKWWVLNETKYYYGKERGNERGWIGDGGRGQRQFSDSSFKEQNKSAGDRQQEEEGR